MLKLLKDHFSRIWSTTRFDNEELTLYARRFTVADARRGLASLSLSLLLLLVASAGLFSWIGLDQAYLYTCTLLSLLAAHIYLSAGGIGETRTLYLLGMTLLIISGSALILLAHQIGSVSVALFASLALLYMVVPMVPWGLREALLVMVLIYGLLTASTAGFGRLFGEQTIVILQFVMIAAGLISLALVARNTRVRRDDIQARFDLEKARDRMLQLSNRDPLSGAWNRRYLNNNFSPLVSGWQAHGLDCHFAFLDVDDFKPFNDRYGHDYGDRVLKWVSEAFTEALGERGILIRMGGDEFALLFAGEAPGRLIEDAMANLAAFTKVTTTRRLPLTLSVGMVSFSARVKVDQAQLYKEADEALYQAKGSKHDPRRGAGFVVNRRLDDPCPAMLKAG